MNIDIEILNSKITELNSLQSELDSIDVTAAESSSGQGANFDMITLIDSAYAQVKASLSALISSTTAYFTTVHDNAQAAEDNCQAHIDELGG